MLKCFLSVLLLSVVLSSCESPVLPPKTYTVTYNANDADSGTVPASVPYEEGSTVIVAGNTGNLTKNGVSFFGWNTKSDGSGINYGAGSRINGINGNIVLYARWEVPDRTFWAQRVTDEGFYQLDAELLAEGAHCLVYAEGALSFSAANAEDIRDEYESAIFPKISGTFGTFEDVDENGKVIILLLDIIDGYNGGNEGYVAGYFYSIDMEPKSADPADIFYYSNEADMIYVDVNPGWNNENHDFVYATIAHELQHGINYSKGLDRELQQDLWINEGLSSGAEYVYGGYQDDRIGFFNADPFGSIGHGNNFYVWYGFWEDEVGDQLANYSTVYLFFQWLRVHASNGIGIYKEILDSQYADYQAVTSAADIFIDSMFNDWETLLSTWMWANIKNESTGFKGYKNNSDLQPRWYPINAYDASPEPPPTSWSLSPGEGLFSLNLSENAFNPVSTDYVKYTNELCRPFFVDYTTNPTAGNFNTYLTVNVDTDIEGIAQEGQIAVSIRDDLFRSAAAQLNNVRTTAAPSHPYPISFADKQAELKARENQGKRKTGADAWVYKR